MKRVKNSIGLVINTDNSKVNYNLIEENKKLKLRIEELEKQLTLTEVGQHRELLIDCVKTCLKDKDSITVEQQVGNYIFLKGN